VECASLLVVAMSYLCCFLGVTEKFPVMFRWECTFSAVHFILPACQVLTEGLLCSSCNTYDQIHVITKLTWSEVCCECFVFTQLELCFWCI